MGSHARGNNPGKQSSSRSGFFRPVAIESRRHDLNQVMLELERLLEIGPGENREALHKLSLLVAALRKILPETHFRDERLRDVATDFALWFSKGPRLGFDYNDEALRAMLLVDIHRLKTSG